MQNTLDTTTQPWKNEILPYAMTQVVLEGITLSEIGLIEKNTIWFHSYVENKKTN